MPGQMRAMAHFLEVDVAEENWPRILEYSSFDWMKANAAKSAPLGGVFWDGGAQTFINKGAIGRWRDRLSADDCAAYEARAIEELETVRPLVGGRERPPMTQRRLGL